MVDVKQYVRFYASNARLEAYGSGGLRLSIVLLYVQGGAFCYMELEGC